MQEQPQQQPQGQVDQFQVENAVAALRAEQNLALGIVGGVAGMLAGAILWAIITVITDYQIGYMAIGVGFLVGAGIRYLGKAIDKSYGIIGGVLALVGCALGNLLSVLIYASTEFEIPFLDVLSMLDLEMIVELMKVTFSPMDLLFYVLAIYFGYKYSFRRVTRQELMQMVQ